VREMEIEQPISQRERRIDERGPGLLSDVAVLRQTTFTLERAHGAERGTEEDAVYAGGAEIRTKNAQSPLDVLDGRPTVTLADRSHVTRPLVAVSPSARPAH
jgi:hypothetical protein